MSLNKKIVRKKFSDDVFARDGHKCRICGRGGVENLDAHHIRDRHEMPKGGYVKENGITLCKIPYGASPSCHQKAELFHITHGQEWTPGMHPDDLYKMIGSSYEQAVKASEAL